MSVPTSAQERIVAHLVAEREVHRAEVLPLPDGSVEAWLHGAEDVLLRIVTVFPDGTVSVRPGIRPTSDTYVGHPEDRPEDEEPWLRFDTPQADWSHLG